MKEIARLIVYNSLGDLREFIIKISVQLVKHIYEEFLAEYFVCGEIVGRSYQKLLLLSFYLFIY